jgi:hypothetical protein
MRNYNFIYCLVWIENLVSRSEREQIQGTGGHGAEENIST